MSTLDARKSLNAAYSAGTRPWLVQVGRGDPAVSPGFQPTIASLYTLAHRLKFEKKKHQPRAGLAIQAEGPKEDGQG